MGLSYLLLFVAAGAVGMAIGYFSRALAVKARVNAMLEEIDELESAMEQERALGEPEEVEAIVVER